MSYLKTFIRLVI